MLVAGFEEIAAPLRYFYLAVSIILAYIWHMRVIIDLPETVLNKLAKKAKDSKRSRKNYMELVLTDAVKIISDKIKKSAK